MESVWRSHGDVDEARKRAQVEGVGWRSTGMSLGRGSACDVSERVGEKVAIPRSGGNMERGTTGRGGR